MLCVPGKALAGDLRVREDGPTPVVPAMGQLWLLWSVRNNRPGLHLALAVIVPWFNPSWQLSPCTHLLTPLLALVGWKKNHKKK